MKIKTGDIVRVKTPTTAVIMIQFKDQPTPYQILHKTINPNQQFEVLMGGPKSCFLIEKTLISLMKNIARLIAII